MYRISPDFNSISSKFDFNYLEQNPNTIFALSEKLEFIDFNQAWFDFAKKNDGEPEISNNVKIGSPFLNSISGELKDFYAVKIAHMIENQETWR